MDEYISTHTSSCLPNDITLNYTFLKQNTTLGNRKRDNIYNFENVVHTNLYFLLTYSILVHQHEYVEVFLRRATDKEKSSTVYFNITLRVVEADNIVYQPDLQVESSLGFYAFRVEVVFFLMTNSCCDERPVGSFKFTFAKKQMKSEINN